jgi:hypothetical protein
MKPLSFHLLTALLLLAATLWSCQSNKDPADQTTGTEQHAEEPHVHTYACPMHPEMQGHEGEKCNICGMPLEHMDHVPVAGNFTMEFSATPTPVVAGKPVSLSFVPKNQDKPDVLVPLDVEHEKKIHLIIVSEDLSWFNHIHPEFQADGRYVVNETFPNGGTYSLYSDFKPSGSTHQLDRKELQVEGKAKPAVKFTVPKTKAVSGDFSVLLKPDAPQFLSNTEIHFDGELSKGGKRYDVNDLQSYLGAKGHMVAIHMASKTYVHLHPEVENDILHFHATFPEPGMYRAWLQFMAEDKLHTVDFTIMTEDGSMTGDGKTAPGEDHSGHKH